MRARDHPGKLRLGKARSEQLGDGDLNIHAPKYHICVYSRQHKSNGPTYYDCDMYTLADRLKWARQKAGWSQEELGKKAGVSQSTIGNLEAGTRNSARRLPQIAAVLGVNALWLAEGRGEPASNSKARATYDDAVTSASESARAVIDAILQADQAGEPETTFKLILRMLSASDNLGAGD
ncbi:helix-turn-helix domain-containing protein [Burkholderia ambifaria]|uniref:helix-turn-helix domain-containing protein n=1 Tax=Burkholderia ambifaria TaxID=152480 RepID=UPI001FC8DDF3|nr:helix-turn-helix transcriptional regulator [Burkholderia ambifaria]